MKKILLLLVAVTYTLQTQAQLRNYDANGKVKILSQKTWISITTVETEIKSEKEAAAAIAGAILSPLIDLGITAIKEKLKQNAAKYANTFVVSATGSEFWASEKKVKLPTLTIHRKVLKKNSSTQADAMLITLVPELSSDKTAFRFKIATPFIYTYSSAKTKRDYDYIDINLDIKFKALLVTKGQYEVKDLRGTSIYIPMVKVGNNALPDDVPMCSGWFPFPTKPTLEVETDVTDKDTKVVSSKGTKEGKPVDESLTTTSISTKAKGTDKATLSINSGLYEFEISVIETNPYKVKAENMQKLIESSADASSALFKAIIDAVFQKEETKSEDKGADK